MVAASTCNEYSGREEFSNKRIVVSRIICNVLSVTKIL